jgi:hypothetical protein
MTTAAAPAAGRIADVRLAACDPAPDLPDSLI